MAGEKEEAQALGKVDIFFSKIANYISGTISAFVAFLFFLITLGAVIGAVAVWRIPSLAPYIIIAPALLGLVAYYNRTFATLLFIAMIAVVLV